MARLFDDVNNPKMKDLVGSIVSDPVTIDAAEPVLMGIDVEHDAWVAAYAAYPMHFNSDGSVPECCLEANGSCEINRARYFAGYMWGVSGPALGAAAQHVLDLIVDPITAMADDHVRLAKPNRTRTHQ